MRNDSLIRYVLLGLVMINLAIAASYALLIAKWGLRIADLEEELGRLKTDDIEWLRIPEEKLAIESQEFIDGAEK